MTVSTPMDLIVSSLLAISSVILAFIWWGHLKCSAKTQNTGTTRLLCVKVRPQSIKKAEKYYVNI